MTNTTSKFQKLNERSYSYNPDITNAHIAPERLDSLKKELNIFTDLILETNPEAFPENSAEREKLTEFMADLIK